MNVQKISIRNFRCFAHLETELHPKMNVIIGNNGAGKSTVLDALSIGIGSFLLGIDGISVSGIPMEDIRYISYQTGSLIDRQPQFPVKISCDGQINQKQLHWNRERKALKGKTSGEITQIKSIASQMQEQIRKGNQEIILPLIAFYGTGRLWAQNPETSNPTEINNRFQGYKDCLSAMSNQKQMLKWFEQMTLAELQEGVKLPELTAVRNAVAECYLESGADVHDVNISFNVRSHQLEITYMDSENHPQKHPFHELSDGYRNTLSLVADIAYRMALLNPQLLENTIKQTDGIVLIDEIDLHLHPIWQKRILNTLQKIFPCIQFIVTTHAPVVISSANQESILILDGQTCTPFRYETYGKDANSVLLEVMGTSERPDEITQLFDDFHHFMDEENYQKAQEILNQLRELLGDNDNGVITADVELNFAKDFGG